MNLPKVKFTDIPISQEINRMHGFLFQDKWGWGKYIIKKHPKIKKVFSFKKEKEQIEFLVKYLVEFKKNNQQAIKNNGQRYERAWREIEKDFFIALSDILGISWPQNRKTIKAMLSVNPICPRFLDSWSFSIFYNYKKMPDAMEVIMHECCHFLYFAKWKKLYPKMSHKKFESPYLEWHLSEIIAPIILNDSRIQKLLKQKAVFYSEHHRLKINRKTFPEYFTDLYKRDVEKEKDFTKFLKEAYQAIKENKKLFKF
jgi:hypothetical protein